MDRNAYALKLRDWHKEFCDVREVPIDLPDAWFTFIAGRLQAAGIAEELPDVVRATLLNKLTRVQITGRRPPWLMYDLVDGIGSGMIKVKDVHPDDHAKLATILDRLEWTGGG